MFSAIAGAYDLNNRVHSLGMDQMWRRYAVRAAGLKAGERVLDAACGTGDLSIRFAQKGAEVIGVDFTHEMLPLARKKAEKKGVTIQWMQGDAMKLPVADESVDVASIAFGIRNVMEPQRVLNEFFRVLKKGGRAVVLEFGNPKGAMGWIYQFYFKKVLPVTATWISGDKTGAYKYLPKSVNTFVEPEGILEMMKKAGFGDVRTNRLTMGVCACSVGVKR